MRILLLSNYYPPYEIGGLEQLLFEIACQLKKRNHDLQILTSNYRASQISIPEDGVDRVLNLESPDHVNYHLHYSLTADWRERQNKQMLTRVVKKFSPDLIFIWGMWNLPVSLAKHAEKLCPGRVVYYVASYWPAEVDAHTAYWTGCASNSWHNTSKKMIGTFIRRFLIPGYPRNHLDFRLVLCVSEYLRQTLINQARLPQERIKVVYNGIKLNDFRMHEGFYNSDVLRLIYTGRLTPDKGVHTAIESLVYLNKLPLNHQVRLTIVGSGTEDYENRLQQLVSKHDLRDQVHFSGWIDRKNMRATLADHDVFLLTSIWPEPLARSIQEAMATGLVVIGTTTGGTQEILQDGVNGLTFEAGDARMLTKKIKQVTAEPGLRIRLAQEARRTIEERFTLDRMVLEIEGYLKQLIHQKDSEIV